MFSGKVGGGEGSLGYQGLFFVGFRFYIGVDFFFWCGCQGVQVELCQYEVLIGFSLDFCILVFIVYICDGGWCWGSFDS